jgi:hypothetical protein
MEPRDWEQWGAAAKRTEEKRAQDQQGASKRSAQEKGKNVVAAVVFDCFIPERSRFATATTSSLLVCAWIIVAA